MLIKTLYLNLYYSGYHLLLHPSYPRGLNKPNFNVLNVFLVLVFCDKKMFVIPLRSGVAWYFSKVVQKKNRVAGARFALT